MYSSVQFNRIIDWQNGLTRFHNQRAVHDYSSVNDSLEMSGLVEGSMDVKPDFLQPPLPSNWQQPIDDYVKSGYFSIPLRPSSIIMLGGQSLPGDDADASSCVFSAAEYETKTSPKTKTVPLQLQVVLGELADVFPAELSPGLQPNRSINHEVVLKPGATPTNRAPFCLSKVEQEALNIFGAERLEKNWIKVSDSPWVSNIFGLPKTDPGTGKSPSRLEWLHSNDPHMPIRWAIAYRLVNAPSDVAKIPLPHIEAVVFSILDLANGYRQMRISPTSKQFTALRMNHDIYRWDVAPMILAGMTGTWTRLMRKQLSHLLFVVVYLDVIRISSRSMPAHVEPL
ncbi:Retroelement pol Polyprotein [Phytophthora megakarya]|uniref:Retroelement pol Polyprotein n=1 Tax=Phytophthora megakarya TaxID=4795 RepID=A0A225WK40_9STRA|nr:Retroelement pol Polyprotein [Phytophthora megakarya]